MSIPQQAPLASPERNRVSVASHSDFIESARSREAALTRLIMAYITSGLVFMLLPGTFFGVWNLLQISGRESAASVSPAWLQAHGHAQVFGWIGSFIFGIGFYSIPKLRGPAKSAFGSAWACWVMWSAGVALRWATNVYGWQWRVLLPVSGVLELAAFIIFFRAVSQHRPQPAGNGRLDSWIWVVISASLGFLLVLIANLAGTVYLSLRGSSPALPHKLNQRYLVLMAWGFLVPFIWGFSAKWMRVFLGLRPLRPKILFSAVLFNLTGVALAIAGNFQLATWFLVVGAGVSIVAMRIFETSEQEAKIRGIHWSFPFFVRMAYFWLFVAAMLGVAASIWDTSGGIWGASRHALTVWICRDNGPLGGATNPAGFRGDAPALESKTYVCGTGLTDRWVLASGFLRSARLPRIRKLGVASSAVVCSGRIDGAFRVYDKHIGDFHAPAEPCRERTNACKRSRISRTFEFQIECESLCGTITRRRCVSQGMVREGWLGIRVGRIGLQSRSSNSPVTRCVSLS